MPKALFLDRDGVINVDSGYLCDAKTCQFIDGIFDLVRFFRARGYLIIVVTNQSGIARGLFSEAAFLSFSNWMRQQFELQDAPIDAIYHCPHHPDFNASCRCRKPQPGMILDAAEAFNIDVAQSLLIGDSERDIQAAARAGITQTFLLCHDMMCTSRASHIVYALAEVKALYEEQAC